MAHPFLAFAAIILFTGVGLGVASLARIASLCSRDEEALASTMIGTPATSFDAQTLRAGSGLPESTVAHYR